MLHFDSLKHTLFLQDHFSMWSMEWGISLWNYIMWVSFTLGKGKNWTWISPPSINTPNLQLLYIIALFFCPLAVFQKKEYFGKMTVGTWVYIQEEISPKRLCMGWDSWLQWQGRYQIYSQFLLLHFLADCLRVATHGTGYTMCFLSSTLPGLNPLLNCPSAISFPNEFFCMSFLLSPTDLTEEGPCATAVLQGWCYS